MDDQETKVLITGAHGLIGAMLVQELAEDDFEILATDIEQMDITDEDKVKSVLSAFKPDFLINCAEISDYKKAEEDPELADMVNGYSVGYIASACKENDVVFFQMSTDQVFGENSPYGYIEKTEPRKHALNHYGASKKLGEDLALANNENSYIVRTSWPFGSYGKNFVDDIIRQGMTASQVKVEEDMVSSPTFTKDISRQMIIFLNSIENHEPGIYHVINSGVCSRYDFASKVFEMMDIKSELVKVKRKDLDKGYKEASFSILKNTKLLDLQQWDRALEEYLQERRMEERKKKHS